MNFKKGDIVIIPVPFTDNKGVKLRPAIVISNEKVHSTNDVMIVQITSKQKQDGLSIPITDADVSDKLPVQSFIRFHKIFILERNLISGKIGIVKKNKYNELIKHITAIIS